MAFGAIVQEASVIESITAPITATLPATPTVGNTLIIWHTVRSAPVPTGPTSGWTAHPSGYTYCTTAGEDYKAAMFYRVVQSGDTTTVTSNAASGIKHQLYVVEVEGRLVLDASSEVAGGVTNPMTISVTPTTTNPTFVIAGATARITDAGPATVTPVNGTEIHDASTSVATTDAPHSWVAYTLAPVGGAVTISGTLSLASRDYGMQAIAFTELPPDPAPGVFFDWDDDGFDTATADSDGRLARMMPEPSPATVSDDVTTRVLSIDWWRGGSYDTVSPNGPGGATIRLNNFDGRFDPDNTASPVYGKMVPGLAVWCGALNTTGALSGTGSAATVRGFFGGIVREWSPTVSSDGSRVVEVICEDALGGYKVPVTVAASLTRSQSDLRAAILTAAGEATARRSLASEPGMLPISAVDGEDGLGELEELNRATASRHYIKPADTKEDWYAYTLVNKYHKLASAADETWNGDDIQDVSNWRLTNANVVKQQRATVVPISLTTNNAVVWTYASVPLTIGSGQSTTIYAEFDDYVFSPTISTNVTSGTIYTEINGYGKTARLRIWATSSSATIGTLQVLGQQVVRGDAEQVIAGDTTAGTPAGATITSDYIGQTAAAQGICDYIVWRHNTPLKRPKLTREGKNATLIASILDRDLYDVVDVVIDKLSVTTRRMEIIGLRGRYEPGRHLSASYELQETPNQSVVTWFTVGTHTVGSAVPIAPF